MMDHLLYLVHRIPYPPNKGDKIRSYHLLQHLRRSYQVHLGSFIDDPADVQHLEPVAALCASSHVVQLNPKLARLRSLSAFAGGRALSLDFYRNAGMQAWVRETVARHCIRRTLVFSSAMAQFVPPAMPGRRVIDFVDIDSDKWQQYAAKKSWPMSWLYGREARCLLAHERAVAQGFEASLFVSQAEATLFRQMAPESAAKVGHFNNGVDTDYFSPERAYANPFAAREQAIVFTGAMDYWPNVDAVQWFARDVMPGVIAGNPDARFCIVGSRPTDAVQQLATLPGVQVTGSVPDVRPYLAHARVAVAPLRIARGIQNKVLEAMAMARPVVVSPQALEGIAAEPGHELLLASDATQYVSAVLSALALDGSDLGTAARHKVQVRYGWEANLAKVNDLLEPRH